MNRRGFLKGLAAVLVLDPERALWVPGARTISIPKLIVPPAKDAGMMFRVLTSYEPLTDGLVARLDMFYGLAIDETMEIVGDQIMSLPR